MDHGSPIAYTVLAEGTPVYTSDEQQIGTVRRVLADEATDIFDGITIDTSEGERFVDAPQIARVYERGVVCRLSSNDAASLPPHTPAPAVVDVDADDITEVTSGGRGVFRRTWDRITGKY